ncbi:LOW QUALITY PROTEIN: hypothetical protein V2J09_000555 [Rumex salicifolius]
MSSLKLIEECLIEFGCESGLVAYINKTKVFFGGFNTVKREECLNTLGFPLGYFYVRYLGIPLNPKRLRIGDYKPLLDRLKVAIGARKMSYAGRVKEFKVVMEGILTFWMQALLLPMIDIKQVEVVCMDFMWFGVSESKRNLVAWKKNKSFLFRLFFDLVGERNKLCTDWARHNMVNGHEI